MKRLVFLFAAISLFASLLSCSHTREFTHCEMTLTLSDSFAQTESGDPFVIKGALGEPVVFYTSNADKSDVVLCDGEMALMLVRISHEAAAGEGIFPGLTQLEFARFYISLSNVDSEVRLYSGIPYCTYRRVGSDGGAFTFLQSFFQTPNAYFVLTFITVEDNFDVMKPTIFEYISSVSFK